MKRKHFILLICLGLFLGAGVVQSAELRVAKEVAETGGEVRFKTLFSVVDGANLAGIKLVLHYNDGAFAYEKFEKSPPAKSMMHVVNDKNPGRLVVVMASATGQPEADYPLFSLSFSMLGGGDSRKLGLKVSEVEMMSADLLEIPCLKIPDRID